MSDDKTKAAALATFTQYLSQHRLRRTPERFAILEKVFDYPAHFSIDALHSMLEQCGYHVSRSTVYNTIQLLIKCSLVRRHSFDSQSPQYEKVAGPSIHHHLICSSCGKIREIKDPEIDRLLASRRFGKFHTDYIDLSVYGLCGSCTRKKRSQKSTVKRKTANHNT
ncbi:MAG: transcriptional repressor [Bacteroides sp.]|nr:transcriptional repressor [Bacteroides sp.]MCM1413474.1 transcriptional repressor [Bacteroides sp.]MCM1471315.1 transcriptional repressor [Bacteroides sp.]